MKRILSSLVLVVLSLFCVAMAYAQSLPKGKPNSTETALRVMTYNVHHCNPPSESQSGKIDIEAIVRVIEQQHPDVVALQEIDNHTTRSGNFNELEVIAQKLNMHFYFGKAMDFGGGEYGVGILSKYPISDGRTYQLPVVAGWKGEPRVLASVTVTLANGKKILFGSTHLEAYSKENRALQVKEIASIATQTKLPMIVAGDFNATPDNDEIKLLDKLFGKTCKTNCPPTFSEEGEEGVIDYIFLRPSNKYKVLNHRVVEEKYASDHFPVVADLKLK